QKFDQNGQFIASFGECGSGAGQFLYPSAVCVDTEGLVYVSDRGNNRIQVFRQVNTPCVTLNDDLALHLYAEHMGIKYGFTMNYSQHPQDPSGFFWKMDLATLMQVSSDTQNCIQMGSDLKLNICTEYHGVKYTFTLDYFPDNIPDEHYWKIDLNTLEEIQ
ncbi:MAG: hypothetical protein GY864_03635, partial [Desulfobacterales bacterium]|nr:hypothetical protein [Desulfobacterales bacterium]